MSDIPITPISETTGGAITPDQASLWTRNYRLANPAAVTAHFFGRHIIQNILLQPGCIGMRMYHALDDVGKKQLLLVGVNAAGNDMTDGLIADMSVPCPHECGGVRSMLSI